MTNHPSTYHRPLGVTIVLLAMLLGAVQSATAESVAEQVAQVYSYYADLEFEKGITLAKSILEQGDLETKDSIAVYSALSLLTFALGDSYLQESYTYLERIIELGPCEIDLPEEYWPQQLRDQWYGVAHAAGALNCAPPRGRPAGAAHRGDPGVRQLFGGRVSGEARFLDQGTGGVLRIGLQSAQ